MKLRNLSVCIFIITVELFSQEGQLHNNWDENGLTDQVPVIHKYLTVQAWDIVRAEHPEVINTDMDIAMRNPNNGNYGDWWDASYDQCGTGKILSGSWREDSEDIIYGYQSPFTTLSHFWLADEGDNHEPCYPCGFPPIEPFYVERNNALQKARELWRSGSITGSQACGWRQQYIPKYENEICIEHDPPPSRIYRYAGRFTPQTQSTIKEVYFSPLDNLVVEDIALELLLNGNPLPQGECGDVMLVLNPPKPLRDFIGEIPGGIDPNIYKKEIWEFIGRICHLIQDQGVPAHTHFDLHVVSDHYEDYYMSTLGHYVDITALKGLLQGGILDVSNKQDPLKYIMYTANQVADRFPSDDKDGDLAINPYHADRYQDVLGPIYANINDGTAQFHNDPPPEGLMEHITDNAGVYSIRATASFLYWVFNEFGIIPEYKNDVVFDQQTVTSIRKNKAVNSISAGNNFTVSNMNQSLPGDLEFQAGNHIRLTDGVSIKSGSTFHAFISPVDVLGDNYNLFETESRPVAEDSISVKERKQIDNIPTEFSISQNYPNPFNPTTMIKYGLKKDVIVKLVIYDVLGKEVKTLVNEFQSAGYKSVMWDGTNNQNNSVSSGLYIYKIVAGDFVEKKKMVIVK